MTWLECTAVPPGNKVDKLKCKVCTKYMDRLVGMRNFRWITGAHMLVQLCIF